MGPSNNHYGKFILSLEFRKPQQLLSGERRLRFECKRGAFTIAGSCIVMWSRSICHDRDNLKKRNETQSRHVFHLNLHHSSQTTSGPVTRMNSQLECQGNTKPSVRSFSEYEWSASRVMIMSVCIGKGHLGGSKLPNTWVRSSICLVSP